MFARLQSKRSFVRKKTTKTYIERWGPTFQEIAKVNPDSTLTTGVIDAIETFDSLWPTYPDSHKTCRILCHVYQRMAELMLKSTIETRSNPAVTPPDTHDLNDLIRLLLKTTRYRLNVSTTEHNALAVVTRCSKTEVYDSTIDCSELKKQVFIVDNLLERLIMNLHNDFKVSK